MDSPSRNLARYIAALSDAGPPGTLRVALIYRTDRYGRGGDQVPMLAAGFPAVRLTEFSENYERQHQDLRPGYGDVIEGVDFPYLAKVTRLNVAVLAALASAPAPPEDVRIEGAVKDDTTISWASSKGAKSYRPWMRDTTSPDWDFTLYEVPGLSWMFKDAVIDDHFFGVQALSADGFASPVVFPGPAGAFTSAPPR